VAAGGALVTLMACYGMVARPAGPYNADCQSDNDRDAVCAPRDCDDARPDVYPGAADPDLDGIDQNCDGVDGWRDPAHVAVEPPAPQALEPPPPEPAPESSP
jgi:hypothetical protein